jgi:hypothetical protein
LRLAPVLLGLFCFKLALLAVLLPHTIPPDETTHLGLAREYAQVALLPGDRPETARLGVVANQPFLYYWLAGKALRLYPFEAGGLVFLRLLNCALGLLTGVLALRWIRLATDSAIAQNLCLVFVTSTLMYTGLFAAVSYDNLANLLSVAALYSLFRYIRLGDDRALLPFVLALAAGCLSKVSFLPLALILTAALAALRHRELPGSLARLATELRAGSLPGVNRQRAGWLLALALAFATLTLYGGNLVRYGHLTPALDQVVAHEIAMSNRIFARSAILEAYRTKEHTLEHSIALADRIRHPADRRSTKALLAITKRVGDERVGLARYGLAWGQLMLERTYGYFGHRVLRPAPLATTAFAVLLGLGCGLAVVRIRSVGEPRLVACALVIAAAYALVLVLGVNRPNYIETGLIDLAVQGRYLFPVLVPLYGAVAIGLTECVPARAQLPSALIAGSWFICAELPHFLVRTGGGWLTLGG